MDIPIANYAAGIEVANDLVSTSPTVRGAEALPDVEALAVLLAGHDLRRPQDEDVFPVQLLRREVRGIIETETEEQAVAGAGVLIGRAGRAPVLRRDPDDRWMWCVPTAPDASLADELAAFIAVGLFGVVRTLGHDRFRACAAPGCRGVFVDASRAGRRRYCMPELCGNRLNVANHRARRRAVTP
ncbi:CGNR zinc finger domain-containing protein [Actinomadura spongiicola]|uniref:CGNR zinc finger domain-containing protein n=1 Tax=Actinomadura spongiicola TaxID=2303421 RepID=A0A372GPD3_9ACTN|nr:CGNR zinc finger domain-containing protein [Actinomadura spongiicola]RFS87257.1 CGNR zinc finger domain-containing protein [Actinomadura spongiicola]